MNISELVEMAIGLVFVYLTVSLACSQLQEVLARWLNWRAKDLEVTLRNMIDHPARTRTSEIVTDWYMRTFHWDAHQRDMQCTKFVDSLYEHPLITGLIKHNERKDIGPEQIPARTFALALFDMIMTAGTDASLIQQQLNKLKQMDNALTSELSEAQQREFSEQLKQLTDRANALVATSDSDAVGKLRKEYQDFTLKYPFAADARIVLQAALPEVGPEVVNQFRRGALRLEQLYPNLGLKRRLDGLLLGITVAAGKEEAAIAAARQNAETWFDDTMTRATVWYKINVQKILLATGLVLAILLNVDSIAIANALWREPTLRQTVMDQAKAVTPTSGGATGDLSGIIGNVSNSLTMLHLPVGWTPCANTVKTPCTLAAEIPQDPMGWATKLLGLVITGLAAMQGGPFWFELLSKLVNIGETTKKEQAAHESNKPPAKNDA